MTAAPTLSTGPLDWSLLDAVAVAPQISARSQRGSELSVSIFDLEPGAIVPEHAHPNEEFGYLISGGLRLSTTLGGERELTAGDSFFVAAGDSHRAVASSAGCQLLECYAPPRIPNPLQETTT